MVGRLLLALALICVAAPLEAEDIFGEFAQYSPQQKRWLEEQTVPGQTVTCCNVSDGTEAQEDIKNGHYVVSFRACYFPGNYAPAVCHIEGPREVPEDRVIKGPNRIGPPVVWYGWENYKVYIRCFIPGAGL